MSAPSAPLLVGLDAGTTRVRALVFDAETCRPVAEGSQPTPMDYPHPGWAGYETEALWRAAAAAIRQALAGVDDPRRIVGIGTSSVGETGIGLDAAGEPTAPAIAWFDKRSHAECEDLRARHGDDALTLRTGMRLDPIAGLPKMLWFKRNHPDAFARTAHWLTVADYLNYRLSGVVATDYSLASRTLALDMRSLAWADDLIDDAGIPRHLFQQVLPSGARLGPLTPEAAAATGLPAHCVSAVAGHDHPLGALAVGVFTPGTLIDSLGTSEACLFAIDRPIDEPAIFAQGFEQEVFVVDRPMYLALGGLYTCGAAVEWFRKNLAGGADFDTLNAGAATVPPGSLGVTFLPHLRLGTPPNLDNRSRGAFIGLSTDATPAVFYRALLEGVAFDLKNLADAMGAIPRILAGEAAGAGGITDAIRRIRIIGGGSKNELLLRIKATVYDRTLDVVEVPEAVSLGAALFAGMAAGVYAGLDAALAAVPQTVHRIEPVPEWRDLYRQRFREVWQPAVKALQPLHWAARGG
ncbi:MAG: FGGY family carbohydrate kinase [Alphaproteobacteria bacterium]